jgi:hypothetical protein
MIVIAQFARSLSLFLGTGFRGGSIFVGAADIQGIVTAKPAVPGIDIGGQYLDEVAKMRDIIYVWQG